MYKVIPVDDEADLLGITRVFLESTGEFSVQPFIPAQDARDCPDLAKSDAIVSDYQMPEMDGNSLPDRNNPQGKRSPWSGCTV